jgi:plastocyanin
MRCRNASAPSCGSPQSAARNRQHAATHARAEVIQIKMEHSGAGTAHVGDTVEWVNADFVAHTATSRDGA